MTHLHQAQHAQRTSRVPRFGVAAIAVAVSAALGGFAEPAAAAGGFNYGVISYTDIADTFTGSPYSQIYLEPSINNAGQVAFSVLTQANIQHVYITPLAGNTFINVADTSNGFTGTYYVTLNNAGTAVFGGTSSTGANANQTGIFTGRGGAISTIVDSTTLVRPQGSGLIPRISDNGTVVFQGYGPGNNAVFVYKNGQYSTIASVNGSQYAGFHDAAINNSGQVAFSTSDYSTGNNNGNFVYRANPGGAPVKISRVSDANVAINDAGMMAFEAAAAVGNGFSPTGLVVSDGVTSSFIARAGLAMPGTNILVDGFAGGKAINGAGLVAMEAYYAGNRSGIYVGDGVNTQTIVQGGQSMFGKTVLDFKMGNDAFNDSGQVTFNVRFTDNTYAVVRTSGVSAVPEPGTAVLMGLGGLACVALRRRRAVA